MVSMESPYGHHVWRPSLLGWRLLLLGWRPSLLGWRRLLLIRFETIRLKALVAAHVLFPAMTPGREGLQCSELSACPRTAAPASGLVSLLISRIIFSAQRKLTGQLNTCLLIEPGSFCILCVSFYCCQGGSTNDFKEV